MPGEKLDRVTRQDKSQFTNFNSQDSPKKIEPLMPTSESSFETPGAGNFTKIDFSNFKARNSTKENTVKPNILMISSIIFMGLLAMGLGLLAIVVVFNSRSQLNLLTWWVETPLTAILSFLIVILIVIRELICKIKGKLAIQIKAVLDLVIPQLLLLFLIIILGKVDIVLNGRGSSR